jgi:hypothetical protein
MCALDLPRQAARRAWTRAFLEAEARAFERVIADAPEQWWTIFFPIWDEPRDGATREPAVTGAPMTVPSHPPSDA